MKKILLMLPLLLASCTYIPTPSENRVNIHNSYITYRIVPPSEISPMAGIATSFLPNVCLIRVSEVYKNSTHILAHELGHCMDFQKIGPQGDIKENDGCVFTKYYCKRSEGYAETYAYVYQEKCGETNLTDLGVPWATEPSKGCVPPLASEVNKVDLDRIIKQRINSQSVVNLDY